LSESFSQFQEKSFDSHVTHCQITDLDLLLNVNHYEFKNNIRQISISLSSHVIEKDQLRHCH